MKIKVVKKGDRYVRRFSLDAEDWVTVIIVALVLVVALIQFVLWG